MSDKFSGFISLAVSALSDITLYSPDHPAVLEVCQKAVTSADELYLDESMSITLLGGTMLFNDAPVKGKGLHLEKLRERLRKKGIEKVVIKKGVRPEELKRFLTGLSSRTGALTSSPHVLVGSVEVLLKPSKETVAAEMSENVAAVGRACREVSRFKKLDMLGLEDAVFSFISVLRRETNVLRIISPIKSFNEHSTNVAVLTVFLAEFLGLKDEGLYEVGLAGLLHDVGKMLILKEVLTKQTDLSKEEWEEMMKHPVLGALYLGTLEDSPELAAIVAYEHHMHFDGGGYPVRRGRVREPHLVSQMVAVADFFDAMRTSRVDGKPLEAAAIIALMKDSSGKIFNPLLVDAFASALKRIEAF